MNKSILKLVLAPAVVLLPEIKPNPLSPVGNPIVSSLIIEDSNDKAVQEALLLPPFLFLDEGLGDG